MGKKTDKRDLPWMPFFVNDFLSSSEVYLMSPEEGWGYLNLLFAQWQSGSKRCIPRDKDELAKLSRLGKKWPRCSARILKQFRGVGRSGLRNKRCAEIYDVQSAKTEKLRNTAVKAGKASAKARAAQAQREVNRCSTNQNQSQNQSQNQKKNVCKEGTHTFDSVFALYPEVAQRGKSECRAEFDKALASGVTADEIRDGIIRYEKYVLYRRRNDFKDFQFQNANKWFLAKGWEDPYNMPKKKGGGVSM